MADNGTVTAEHSHYPDGSIRNLKNGSLYTEYACDADKNLLHLKTMMGTEVLADSHYAYDPNGNRTEKVETFDGHVQINRYDAEGLRHELEEDGKLVQFIFRGDEAATEEKDSNIIRFIRGYDLVASDAENARTYYHYASDEMSSITHVVTGEEKECGEEPQQNPQTALSDKADAAVLNNYEYDAWGNTTVCEETVENRFKFNGQQYDPVTQQYYLRARFYNPIIARFTQEDTYRGDGLNLYAYCKNHPVYYEDPSGHWCDRKEKVYKDLLQERGITEADLANDPDLKLRLMAEASNIVKSQKRNNSSENKPNTPKASNLGDEPTKYGSPYSQLSRKQKRNLRKKLENRTITKDEYNHLEWDRRFGNRRKRGVDRFWSKERNDIINGGQGTRNWNQQQRQDIINKKTPTYNGKPIEGHHKYNAIDYPQIADAPNNIYPATNNEHFERWHGGNCQNDTNGVPNNPDFPKEF